MCIQGFGGETLRERDYLEDPGVDGTIILSWIFRKCDGGRGGMDWIDLAQEAGTFNCSNEHSVSIKRREFFD
jgi:hypothetical protein